MVSDVRSAHQKNRSAGLPGTIRVQVKKKPPFCPGAFIAWIDPEGTEKFQILQDGPGLKTETRSPILFITSLCICLSHPFVLRRMDLFTSSIYP